MAQQPSMQVWTDTWHHGNRVGFKNIYSKNALIFPPKSVAVQGNEDILEFMSGGIGKVDVFFESDGLIFCENLAFESGVFKDMELSGNTILGKGTYSVTWILEDSTWKILSHSWSIPVKEN